MGGLVKGGRSGCIFATGVAKMPQEREPLNFLIKLKPSAHPAIFIPDFEKSQNDLPGTKTSTHPLKADVPVAAREIGLGAR
jgi:hypothetical protein